MTRGNERNARLCASLSTKQQKDLAPKTSRAGSHAGRGFRYQDAVGVWLAVQCWIGKLRYGELLPEGQDDYEFRSSTQSNLVQVKSRRNHLGAFPVGEAAQFVQSLWARSEGSAGAMGDLILVLERPVLEGPIVNCALIDHPGLAKTLSHDHRWAVLAQRTYVWIVPAPFELAVTAISDALPCSPLAAQVHYAELLHWIGSLADANGLVKDSSFGGLAASDVEAGIRRIEPLLDLSGMQAALRDGYCDAIDFLTPLDDPTFYQGINARPGHLAAGLIAERPAARYELLTALDEKGAALIVGPSGAGKSALMWEAARASRHTTRWFEVKRGDVADAYLFIRLARALRASPSAPVGFVIDDLGRGLSGLWDEVIRESGPGSGILLLGSIREEDVFLLPSRSRAREIRATVEEVVAERIWRQLLDQGQTSWAGWREPWQRSNGLLLEYAHILTRGDRLEIVLGEQVDRRLREARDTELAILRVTALAGTAGATLDVERLPGILSITSDELARSLRRLMDEHLIAEPEAGLIGGLHQLRSTTLFKLCHAHPPPMPSQTIRNAVLSATGESLGALATYVVVNCPDETNPLVESLAARLERDRDPVTAVAILSGLGQAHIETTLRHWVPKALSLGLEPTQITLVVMFALAGTDFSSLPFHARFQETARELRTLSVNDPRLSLLSVITPDAIGAIIAGADTTHLRALTGALLGVEVPECLRSALSSCRPDFEGIDLAVAADLLGAIRLVDPQTAIDWTSDGVGERLLARVPIETPWAGPIEVEVAPEGRLLRSSIYHVAPSVQSDVHNEVVQLCERLLGLDPLAKVVAVDAVAADGALSGMSDCPMATKRIPRENLPNSALPQWNQRWITASARLIGVESHTEYLQRAHALLKELVPALERAIDTVLRRKIPPSKQLDRLSAVHLASRELTPPREGLRGDVSEKHVTPLQNALFSCSADLIRRFAQLPEGYGAFVMWAGDLIKSIRSAQDASWDLIGEVPEDLLLRLESLVSSLRLLAAEAGHQNAQPMLLWISATLRADRGNALHLAKVSAEHCLKERSARYLRDIKSKLIKSGIELELHSRPDWSNPLPWPALEILATVALDSPIDWFEWLARQGENIRTAIGDGRFIRVIPRIGGLMASRLTVGGVSTLFPSPYAADDWLDELGIRRLDDVLVRAAAPAIELMAELDGIRRFSLGAGERPSVEHAVRENDEQRLSEAIDMFEVLAEGKSVQPLIRLLSEEVAAGRVGLAEGVAAMTHGKVTTGIERLIALQIDLLTQDIATATLQSRVQG